MTNPTSQPSTPGAQPEPELALHASVVAFVRKETGRDTGSENAASTAGPHGVILLGPSGAGKSALALQLIALGARLVADDRVALSRRGASLIARAVAPLHGMIEARGVGLLRLDALPETPLALAVDLGQIEFARMPPERHWQVLGVKMPLLHCVESGHFPAAVMQYVLQAKVPHT